MTVAKTIDWYSEEYILGQRIQHIRKKRGLPQTQLGNLMGMDRAAISNYENGSKGEMGFKTLQKFAKALGVTTSVLLGEESEAEKEDKPAGDILDMLSDENKEMILKMAQALILQQQMGA